MKIRVINRSVNELPSYATMGSAGMDLRAANEQPITLDPGQRVVIPTGLYVEIPKGYEIQVRPRSGLSAKHGLTVLNAPGTIDSDYRGEIGVILHNTSDQPFVIDFGLRIAQAVVARYEIVEWESTDQLSSTEREFGGFGSTGA